MLKPQNEYNILDELIKQQISFDEEHNLIPNFSEYDTNKIEKIQTQETINIIKSFITNCKIKGDFSKLQYELQEYAKKYIKEKYPILDPKTILNITNNQNEILNLLDYPALNSFVLYLELTNLLYFYLQEIYIKKLKSDEILIPHTFIEYSLELLNGIKLMLLNENINSVLILYRTFYENYIVFSFLQKYPELQEAFIESKNEPPDDFSENYGWTEQIITDNKNRNLKTMFKESGLSEDFGKLYKLSCKYTHSTATSLFERPNFNEIEPFLYGIDEIIKKEFNSIFSYIKFKSKKEEELLKQWLYVSSENYKETFKEFQ